MKKLFLFASAAALLATSCSDDLGIKQEPQGPLAQGNTKLVASYPIGSKGETRTTLNQAGDYTWSPSDAIGVYGVDGAVISNTPFSYSQPVGADAGEFRGDIYALYGTQLFGYYPYNKNLNLGSNKYTIPMSIDANQDFNHATLDYEWTIWNSQKPSTTFSSGSFSSMQAPAVGWGSIQESTDPTAENELVMQFYPVASYLVVPIKALEPTTITKLELTIGESQNINGTFTVDMSGFTEGYPEPKITTTAASLTGNPTTTLYCGGKGVTIGTEATPGTNFWFVIPSCTGLQGNLITVKAFAEGENGEETFTITNNVPANGPEYAGMNNVYTITPTPGEPYVFNTEDYFIVQNEAQFLEYVYLLTYGPKALQEYLTMYKAGGNMSNSVLPEMLEYATGKTSADFLQNAVATANNGVAGIKSAKIVNNLDMSPSVITALTGINANSNVPAYYVNVYRNYIANEGWLQYQISSGAVAPSKSVTICGSEGNSISISNFNVAGNGMFNIGSGKYVAVKDLTLSVGVQWEDAPASGFYYLLNWPQGMGFTNVTLAASSFINNEEGEKVTGSKAGVFGFDASSFYNYTTTPYTNNTTGVINQASNTLMFANDLRVNSSYFDFTQAYHKVLAYNTVTLVRNNDEGQNGYGAVLRIENPNGVQATGEANAATLMSRVVDSPVVEGNPIVYSIVDNASVPYSYWTGRCAITETGGLTYTADGTAEKLAYIARNGGEFEADDYNLDLMGVYGTSTNTKYTRWYAGMREVVTVTGKPGFTIRNAYIDGTTNGEDLIPSFGNSGNTYYGLTLFGNAAVVNNVNISGLNIQQTTKLSANQVIVAAIANVPSTVNPSSNITVSDYNVTTNYTGNKTLGGLYGTLDNDFFAMLKSPINVANFKNSIPATLSEGYLAGTMTYNVSGATSLSKPLNITNPAIVGENVTDKTSLPPFGVFNILITSSSNNTYYIQFNGFGTSLNYTNLNIKPADKVTPNVDDVVYVLVGSNIYAYTYVAATQNTPGYYKYNTSLSVIAPAN